MYGLYTPVLLLQAFCIYHAYRNGVEYRWYWFIILFPLFGCVFYLIHHFNNRASINNITEAVKGVVNSNYKIEQLERAYEFSDTLTNRVNLADAYITVGRAEEAINLYKQSLTGFMADDIGLRMKLLHALYVNHSYQQAVDLGSEMEGDNTFKKSLSRIAYAWALHHSGRTDSAERVFQDMDKTNTNYEHRVEYCKFLQQVGRTDDMRTKAQELFSEFEFMRGPERKLHRDTINELKDLSTAATANR
ncbi:MAG TPA: hypothetical protein VGD65_25245 [Chryseosolibacter sp.]